jgi:hypothetical protein
MDDQPASRPHEEAVESPTSLIEIHKDVRAMHRTLFGNGKPDESAITRLMVVERAVCRNNKIALGIWLTIALKLISEWF